MVESTSAGEFNEIAARRNLRSRRYFDFAGRSRRKEYWNYVLFYLLIYVGLLFIDAVTGTFSMESELGFLSGLFALGTLIPSIAAATRRLHDTQRSGWWQLIIFIPVIGFIVLVVFLAQDSKTETSV